MGIGHAQTMSKIEEAKLTCVCDADEKAARAAGKQLGVKWYSDYRDLIDSGKADAVIVATPHYFHPPIGIYAMRKGLHLLSEKPIAVAVGAADRMIKTARKTGVKFAVMFQFRAEPCFRAARKLIENGKLGEIYRVNMVMGWYRTQAYYDSATWRATWRGEGGGVLLNQAPHNLDIFAWLGGMPSVVDGTVRTQRHEIEVEDEAFATLLYPNGASGYLYVSVNEVPGVDHLSICGDKGKIVLTGDKLEFFELETPIQEYTETSDQMWATPNTRKRRVRMTPRETGHKAIIRNFARAILHDEPLLSPGEEGVNSLELANAIIYSGKTGRPAKLPLDRKKYEELLAKLKKTSRRKKRVKKVLRVTDPAHVA
jgi:predicted dehydrogenase